MRVIAHISDLHFGTELPRLADRLALFGHQHRADLLEQRVLIDLAVDRHRRSRLQVRCIRRRIDDLLHMKKSLPALALLSMIAAACGRTPLGSTVNPKKLKLLTGKRTAISEPSSGSKSSTSRASNACR